VPRVLLVDDDATVARAIGRVLKSHGLTATLAATAGAAIEILGGERFDLVLCDLALGGESGLTVLEHLRGRADQTPFVLISGYSGAERTGAEQDPRIAAVLLKPFDAGALGRVLRDVIRSPR
jgi:DNA-binding NtrC family response regulator